LAQHDKFHQYHKATLAPMETTKKEKAMSTLQRISITALTVLALGTVGASAAELPQYAFAGFPISPAQVTVLGIDDFQERPPTPALTLNGMPASPHQIAVIGPRTRQQIGEKTNKDAPGISAQTTN
jgi:hypothetical protein